MNRPRKQLTLGTLIDFAPTNTLNLSGLIEERAFELGFSACGIVPARPLAHAEHFDRWIAGGYHGEMKYMERHRALRVDPRVLEPGTKSVIVLAAPYPPRIPTDDPAIARYALGDDYHDVLRDRMRELGAFVAAEAGCEVNGRPAVDSAPLLERNLAVDAGIGWLGKSSMVLRQSQGSYFFLSELLVDTELVPVGSQHPDRCGRCTRCLDACPTGAIVAPFRVDARRCISYLTIELRSPIPRALRPAIGHRLFGCDVCQAVCPWNRDARQSRIDELQPRPEVVSVTASRLLNMSQAEFSRTFRKSAIKRTKRRGLARNAAVVLGNSGDRDRVTELSTALHAHDEPIVRGHAAWALGRLGGTSARRSLDRALGLDEDAYVREEIRFALDQTGT